MDELHTEVLQLAVQGMVCWLELLPQLYPMQLLAPEHLWKPAGAVGTDPEEQVPCGVQHHQHCPLPPLLLWHPCLELETWRQQELVAGAAWHPQGMDGGVVEEVEVWWQLLQVQQW
jgi:hypothetical protein